MAFYTLVATGIYTGLITGISTITLRTCRTITSIYNHQNPNADKYLRKLDLERKLKIIESVLNKTPNNYNQTEKFKEKMEDTTIIFDVIKGEQTMMSDPIELCLYYLHQTISDIHGIIEKIHIKVNYHNTKWFSSWRNLNIKNLSEELETNIKILDNRFDDLIRICQLRHINDNI